MNAWINQMAGLAGLESIEIDFSLTDMGVLFQQTGLPWILAVVAFFLIAAYEDACYHPPEDRESDTCKD